MENNIVEIKGKEEDSIDKIWDFISKNTFKIITCVYVISAFYMWYDGYKYGVSKGFSKGYKFSQDEIAKIFDRVNLYCMERR